jgi:WD40 repeat protein
MATGEQITPPLEHPDEITAAAFSPDGRRVLTVCKGNVARLWEPNGDRLVRALGEGVEVAAFAPDGQTVATGHSDGKVLLWEADTGKLLHSARPGHDDPVQALAFTPQRATLLTGAADGTIWSWDARTLKPAGPTFPRQPGAVRTMRFSPDGRRLLTISKDKGREGKPAVRMWDATTGKHKADLPHDYWVWAVAFSPDSRLVCTGGEDHVAQLWETETGKAVFEHPLPHQDVVRAVAFSPDGKTLLTGSGDLTARLWLIATGAPIGQLLEHQGPVRSVGFTPDGASMFTASADGTTRIWEPAPSEPYVGEFTQKRTLPPKDGGLGFAWGPVRVIVEPPQPPALEDEVMSVAWGTDGRTIALGTKGTGQVLFWRLQREEKAGPGNATLREHWTGKQLEPFRHKDADAVWVVAFDPRGEKLLEGNRDGTIHLLDLQNHQAGQALPGWDRRVRSAAYSPDGHFILVGGGAGTGEARLLDAAGNALGEPLEKGPVVWQVALGPDNRTCAVASGDSDSGVSDVCLWNIGTDGLGRERYILPPAHQTRVVALAFSPDGRMLLTGSTDMTVRLWDVSDPSRALPLGEPLQHSGAVWSAGFSADSATVVTGCRDGKVRLWDAATGTRVGPPLPHDDVVWAVACHPRDSLVLTGSADGRARLWRLPDPVTGNPERINLWVQVSTGMELDERGVPHSLDPDTWRDRQRRLRNPGSPPLP